MPGKKIDLSNGGELQCRLAKCLIQIKEGERLPSIRELAASTRTSVGAVSQTLNSLENIGAVKIRRRGRLGSFVEARALGELWTLAEGDPLVIAMTLPLHLRFEGLATGLKNSLGRAGIAAYLIFIRGSRTRLKALRENRCHVVVMSCLSTDELSGDTEEILLRLPPGSWLSDHIVFYRPLSPEPGRRLRVAVDQDSYDHQRLTELEFAGQEVELRRVSYLQIPRLLKSSQVDATVWTPDQIEAFLSPGILHRPLSDGVMNLVGESSISAAFVARAGSDSVRAVLEAALDVEEILDIQRKVVAGEIIPEY